MLGGDPGEAKPLGPPAGVDRGARVVVDLGLTGEHRTVDEAEAEPGGQELEAVGNLVAADTETQQLVELVLEKVRVQ